MTGPSMGHQRLQPEQSAVGFWQVPLSLASGQPQGEPGNASSWQSGQPVRLLITSLLRSNLGRKALQAKTLLPPGAAQMSKDQNESAAE